MRAIARRSIAVPKPIRLVLLLLLMAAPTAPLHAQSFMRFDPTPPRAGQPIMVTVDVPVPGCLATSRVTVTRNGSAFTIDYAISDQLPPCGIGTPPPFSTVVANLDPLPPGTYTVTATGVGPNNAPLPVATGSFGIAVLPVPGLTLPGVVLLALAAWALAWRARRA